MRKFRLYILFVFYCAYRIYIVDCIVYLYFICILLTRLVVCIFQCVAEMEGNNLGALAYRFKRLRAV